MIAAVFRLLAHPAIGSLNLVNHFLALHLLTGAGFGLAWVKYGRITPQARGVIAAIQNAAGRGLNDEDYDGPLERETVFGYNRQSQTITRTAKNRAGNGTALAEHLLARAGRSVDRDDGQSSALLMGLTTNYKNAQRIQVLSKRFYLETARVRLVSN